MNTQSTANRKEPVGATATSGAKPSKADDSSNLMVEAGIKIFDPTTGVVIHRGRA